MYFRLLFVMQYNAVGHMILAITSISYVDRTLIFKDRRLNEVRRGCKQKITYRNFQTTLSIIDDNLTTISNEKFKGDLVFEILTCKNEEDEAEEEKEEEKEEEEEEEGVGGLKGIYFIYITSGSEQLAK
ncbi:hypothetical protein V1478_018649 [Vespula squamosa]|uniref:Uncharacterized protein n=1 Tax=Vespula squamosa TaxID=30214 RepID=A0ABD1ZTD4_VESSQ